MLNISLEDTPLIDRILMPRKNYFHGAEIYLIIILIVFGVATSFLLPISGGFDEETHLMRVWEMSANSYIPNNELDGKMLFPALYWELSYRRQEIIRAVEPGIWEKYGKLTLDAHDYVYNDVETRSVYSPPLLLPQALVMRLFGRNWQLPALFVFYSTRLIGLLSYTLLVWLAVRLIPQGKWILAVLVSSPVAILQAATISADAINNGIAFLFIGGTLAIAQRKEIHWKEWLFLVTLFFLLFWGKFNIVPLAILPFLIICPIQFKMRHGYLTLLIVTAGLCLLEVLGWNMLASSGARADPEGVSIVGQIRFIAANPIMFSTVIANDVWGRSVDYVRNWIAIYSYNYWPVPTWTYYLYMAGLLAALFVKENENGINKWFRIVLVIVFAISYLGTIISLYIAYTPVGSNSVDGIQGRYFITVMPLLFLALTGSPYQKWIRVSTGYPIFFGGMSLVLYVAGMYLSYHVPCGSQYYQPGLCFQPYLKNSAPDDLYSPPISNQLTLTQEIVPECNGMTELRVWVNANGASPDGSTDFILKDINLDQELINLSIINSELPNGDWFPLSFAPDWASDGKFYLLTIRKDGQGDLGPRIAYTQRSEYTAGKMYENDQPILKDLIFQTGCIAGFDIPR